MSPQILSDQERKSEEARNKTIAAAIEAEKVEGDKDTVHQGKSPDESEVHLSSWFQNFKKNTIDRDVHAEGLTNEKVSNIHANGEIFETNTEEVFKYLQVFTACCDSLAHGANDVANAIGPLAAVAQIWQTGSFNSKSKVDKYVLLDT